MNYQESLALSHALFHDDKQLFIMDIEKKGFKWFELTSKSIRVLTGNGTVIDYNF